MNISICDIIVDWCFTRLDLLIEMGEGAAAEAWYSFLSYLVDQNPLKK